MNIDKMSDKELKSEYLAVNDSIENIGCFGSKDLMWRQLLESELEKRNIEIIETNKITFRKG